MNADFDALVQSLVPAYRALMAMDPVRADQLPRSMPKRGIYLFSDGAKHLYVGRSDNIRRRIGNHCRTSSQHNQATFAFRWARSNTGRIEAAYSTVGSRSAMLKEPAFAQEFSACKARIRSLDLRYVEEDDPVRQALLEIYVATVLQTPFNDFANH